MDRSRQRLSTAVRQANRRSIVVQSARGIPLNNTPNNTTVNTKPTAGAVKNFLGTPAVRKALEDVAAQLLAQHQNTAKVSPPTTQPNQRKRGGQQQQQQQQQGIQRQSEANLLQSFGRKLAIVVEKEMNRGNTHNAASSNVRGGIKTGLRASQQALKNALAQRGGTRGRVRGGLQLRGQNRGAGGRGRAAPAMAPIYVARGGRGGQAQGNPRPPHTLRGMKTGPARGGATHNVVSTEDLDRQIMNYRN